MYGDKLVAAASSKPTRRSNMDMRQVYYLNVNVLSFLAHSQCFDGVSST